MQPPYQVRDIWLAAFGMTRGAQFFGAHVDNKGYTYWTFEPEDMKKAAMEWAGGDAQVNVRHYHTNFLYLKGMLTR